MNIVASQAEGRVPVTIFEITGDIGAESSGLLRLEAQRAVEAGTRYLLLDLSAVMFISSAGLRAIHQIFMLLRTDSPEESDDAVHRGITSGTYHSPFVKLLKPRSHVLQALKLAGFDMFLEIHSDLQAAIASF
jgi:hypothetical protein